MSRASRKLEHLNLALKTEHNSDNGFNYVHFVHQALPEVSLEKTSLLTNVGGLSLGSPIIINAMTGGASETEKINHKLAKVAKETGLAIAVGSQMSAIKDNSVINSYEIVRKANPNGIIFANIGAEATKEQAREAVEMIGADALQIHLNVIQELLMPEGDRNFEGALERILDIKEALNVPIIIKEVGFGISYETATRLFQNGLRIIDVGGKGGTNFALIENNRRESPLSFFNNWGIDTATSILEVKEVGGTDIIATGGIHNGLHIAKAIGLGASAVGIAGALLKRLITEGEESTIQYIHNLHKELSLLMTGLGARTITELQQKPMVVLGDLKDWCEVRGIDTRHLARK